VAEKHIHLELTTARSRISAVSIDNDFRQALEICNGDAMAALRMVLIANAFYEEEIRRLKQEASTGYGRGKIRKPAQTKAG
jgi:DNA-binding GntR family transcriptional regulator